jgi:hypothetical protein
VPATVRSHHVETVYVVGSHDDFTEAMGDKIAQLAEDNPESYFANVKHISHSFAFAEDGKTHWSAILIIEMRREEDSSD